MSDVTIEEGSPVELTVEEGDPIALTLSLGPAVLDGDKGDVEVSSNGGSWTVEGLQGRAVSATAPSNGYALVWNSATSEWEPQAQSTDVADGDKGDITVSSSGATWTIDAGAVTYAKIQNVAASRLLGRMPGTAGDVQEIEAGAFLELDSVGGNKLTLKDGTRGDLTLSKSGETFTVANDAVTYAKIQNVSTTDRLLGRQSAGAGDVEEITCTAAGRAILDDADAAAQRTTLGLAAGGAGDIWVEKAGDTMTGTLTSTIASTTNARCITASGTSTSTASTNVALNSISHAGAPTSNSTSQFNGLAINQNNFCGTGITTFLWYGFTATGMTWGPNADGAVTQARGNSCFGAIANAFSVATTGTLSSALGVTGGGAARFGGSTVGTINTSVGVQGQSVNDAGFTITDAIGLQALNSGSGNTITNCVGVDVAAQTRGSTTNIGLRVAAASGGSTTAAIQLSGTTGAASGLLFATDVNLYRSAANVLKTDDTFEAANVSGTNTGDQLTYGSFTPVDNAPPAANAATSGLRNRIPILEFDDATNETAYFVSIMPQGAKLASGLKVRIHWTAATATSGNCYWAVAFERLNTDIDADSFGADTLSAATTNGTSGVPNVTEITVTTIDGITAGDAYRLRIVRQASDALDTMTGDAQIIAVEIRSAV